MPYLKAVIPGILDLLIQTLTVPTETGVQDASHLASLPQINSLWWILGQCFVVAKYKRSLGAAPSGPLLYPSQ